MRKGIICLRTCAIKIQSNENLVLSIIITFIKKWIIIVLRTLLPHRTNCILTINEIEDNWKDRDNFKESKENTNDK